VVLSSGADDEAVAAVATNNLMAARMSAEGGDAPGKALAAELLRKLEPLFDKARTSQRLLFLTHSCSEALLFVCKVAPF
jgi:hypothetical protein